MSERLYQQRRIQTLKLWAQGFSYSEIASKLGVSQNTIMKRLRYLREQRGVESTLELCNALDIEVAEPDRYKKLRRHELNSIEKVIVSHIKEGSPRYYTLAVLKIDLQKYRYAIKKIKAHYGVEKMKDLKQKLN